MRPVQLTRQLAAAAVGAISASQTPGGAGNLLINGSLAAGGVATFVSQQRIGITSGGNIAARVFTVTGTDDQGRVISETITGVNVNTVQSVLDYLTVTKITIDAASASALTVDTVAVGASGPVPVDIYLNPFSVSVEVEVTGTLNYSVQWTLDDPYSGVGPFNWFSGPANLVAATTTQAGSIIAPVRAIRLLTNSGAGTGEFTVTQAGAL